MALSILTHKAKYAAIILALCAVTSACEPMPRLQEDTELSHNRLATDDSYAIAHLPAVDAPQGLIERIARAYDAEATGPLHIAFAYDPAHEKTTGYRLHQDAEALSRRFHKAGVTDTKLSIIPLSGGSPDAVVGYETRKIGPSAECAGTEMPGYDNPTRITMDGYRLGCRLDFLLAMQVADPADLDGQAGLGSRADGRRAANVVDTQYRTGETHDYLEGFVINELGGGQ